MKKNTELLSLRDKLEQQLADIEDQLEQDRLLCDIWLELGPYTPHLSNNLRSRLQNYFKFDDSE